MTTLVYVHGTNGSGKSTLARAIIREAGGVQRSVRLDQHKKAIATLARSHIGLVGAYETACGGADGLSPYAAIHDVLRVLGERSVFAEGLITPGVDTCKKMASYFDQAVFIHLDTPVDQCIAQVLRRRKAKGNAKPYNPANLYKKAQSAASWANRLEAAGLDVRRLPWLGAYYVCLDELGLKRPRLPL